VGTDASAVLAHVTISDGNADGGFPNDQGGGLRVDNRFSSSASTGASIFSVLFSGNSAVFHGGGVAAQSASPTLVNCQFVGNSSGANGSGVASLNSFGAAPGNPLIVNATFSENTGPQGVVTNLDTSSLTMHNSIVWGNADANTPIGNFGPGDTTATYSIIEGGYTGPGTNILNVDPLYADPDGADNMPGTIDDDLSLQSGSPAVDAGDNTVLVADIADLDSDGDRSEAVPLDFTGLSRLTDDPSMPDSGNGSAPLVDLGARERLAPDEIFADSFEDVMP
jgi:predicted outer membrane repeat protein